MRKNKIQAGTGLVVETGFLRFPRRLRPVRSNGGKCLGTDELIEGTAAMKMMKSNFMRFSKESIDFSEAQPKRTN
jgi:hypothetical protein